MSSGAPEAHRRAIRVMLVEDHQTMLWGLQKLIDGERPRMEVVGVALTCDDAVAKAAQLTPDVILLDLDLAGVSALEILPELLANGVSRVLLLTAERHTSILDKAVRYGARGTVHKEAAAGQVLMAIEKTHCGELWLDRESMGRLFGDLLGPRASRKRDPELEKQSTLTARERHIVDTMVEQTGSTNKAMALHLFISEHTLRNHLTSIYHKLGVTTRLELYVYAVRHRLARPKSVTEPPDEPFN